MRAFLIAVQFLTRIPVRLGKPPSEGEVAASVACFPLVGLIVGGILALTHVALGPYLPPMVEASVLLVGYILVTGGIHLDGLMDTVDGLSSSQDPERILAVMKDSRVGAMGVAAAAVVILARYSVYGSLPGTLAPGLLVAAAVSSRWSMGLCMALAPYARQGSGLGRSFVEAPNGPRLLVATLLATAIALAASGYQGLGALGASAVATGLFAAMLRKRVGGITGDTLGALNEITEVTSLLVLVVLAGMNP
jgi:adenosylcobinamide-GDP ribazoletransferase